MTREGKRLILSFFFLFIFLFLSGCNSKASVSQETESSQTAFQLEFQKNEDIDSYKSYQLPILLNIGAARYCPSCKQILPQISALYKEVKEKAIVKNIDLETYPKFKQLYSLKKIPTQVFIPVKGKGSIENLSSFNLKEIKGHGGNPIYLLHEGFLSKNEMKTVLKRLGMK